LKLNLVYEFLKSLPVSNESSDRGNITIRCPFCGDSVKSRDHGNFSIKIDVKPGEPMLYRCFRANCGISGILKSDTLQKLGCTNMNTLLELSKYNHTINKNLDKEFISRKPRNYQMVNITNQLNLVKLNYINRRLGTTLTIADLKILKIQLSLYDFLKLNNIHKLSYNYTYCDLLNQYCISFVSMYSDYLICRDISKKLITNRRYTIYRTTGVPSPEDIKLYSIPAELDLLSPVIATINIAEGPFSILGAYFNTNMIKETENVLWLANCGSDYLNSILHVCKQYGLLDVKINIWSDSEIKLNKYEKLLKTLQNRLIIREFSVLYNTKAEDFGHDKDNIAISKTTLLKL